MNLVLPLLAIQIALGGFDNLWHHELCERLPAKRSARAELAMHALRELSYGVLFGAVAWWAWHGAWTVAIAALLFVEVAATLADFVIEDATRRLLRFERVLHTVLAINFGALLVAFAPTLLAWARLPTAIEPCSLGAWSWLLTLCGAGVLAWSARNAIAAVRHFRAPKWESRLAGRVAKPGARRVLISGATGFIGRNLAYRLLERGEDVIALTRDREKALGLFGAHAQIVTDLATLDSSARIDAIVNLAGAPLAAFWWTEHRKRTL
jgi:uncharacterized protein